MNVRLAVAASVVAFSLTACATQEQATGQDGSWASTTTIEGNVTPTMLLDVSTQLDAGVTIEPLVVLDDGDEPILGRPRWVSVDPTGRFVIGDRTDRDIKVYSSDGRRSLTIGRAGEGPGELAYLSANAIVGDSIVAYDFALGRLTFFAFDGTVVKSLKFEFPPPSTVRAADDSTLLLVGRPLRRGNLLRLARTDGSIVREFFRLAERWDEYPATLQHMAVFADSFGGLTFAGMFGGDQLRVFDHEGSLLAEAPIDSEESIQPLDELVRENRGELHRPDGKWVHHGKRMLMSVVAMADSTVALQIAPYDGEVGTDILDGGTILVLRYRGGTLDVVGRIEAGWGLVGRDAVGGALVMRYDPSSPGDERYEIGRIIVPAGGRVVVAPARSW